MTSLWLNPWIVGKDSYMSMYSEEISSIVFGFSLVTPSSASDEIPSDELFPPQYPTVAVIATLFQAENKLRDFRYPAEVILWTN